MATATRAELCAKHALSRPGAWPDEPWEGDRVAKVGTKIFAFLHDDAIVVKCARSRDEADEWLHRHPGDASVAAYIGRHGWNRLATTGGIELEELLEAVDTSWALVVATLPRAQRP